MKNPGLISGDLVRRRFAGSMILCVMLGLTSRGLLAQPVPDFEANIVAVCVGTPVTFTDRTENITGTATYLWNFGTGATPSTANVPDPSPVTYSITGPATVTLTVTDEIGSVTETKINYITVGDAAPVFTSCPGPPLSYVCDPGQCYGTVDYSSLIVVTGSPEPVLTYTFTGATTGSGSGTGSGSQLTIGTTTVEITATNGCSPPAICNFIVVVNTPPVADAGGPYNICQGSSVTLDGTGSSEPDAGCGDWIMGYGWDIGNDGDIDIYASQPTVTYASLVGYGLAVGENTIRLVVDDTQGGISTDYTILTINPLPVVSIVGPATICIGGTTTLSPSAGGTWVSSNVGVATVTAEGVVTGISEGQTNFTFTETATGCSRSTGNFLVNPLPTVTLGALPSLCVDAAAINLTQGSPAGGTYSGTGITDGSAGLFDPSVAGAGTHTITYTYTDGTTGCTGSTTGTITVNVCTKTLNITLFLEGLYDGVNGMVKVQNCTDGENSFDLFAGNICDTLTVELARSVFPYNTVFSQHGAALNTDGTISLTNIPGNLSESYHVVIKHRNHLETWSQSVSFTGSLVNYNFTDAVNKAWGDNMVLEGSNYCLYTGDTNDDEYVDAFDLVITFNLNRLSGFGYQVSDINADGFVDVFDLVKVFNNNRKGAGMNTPLAPMK